MKRIKRALILSMFMIISCMSMTGCVRKYDKPELVTIEASQTAFLIPLVGNSNEQADADAYVTIKAAEAQAEANQKLSASLTPELMKLQQIQELANKWNGEVPQVMGADGSILGLDLTNGETTK